MLVLASSFPEQLPELIAYQLLIVQHSCRFQYPSWLRYDIEFRQWSAQNNFVKWSQIHPQFYAFAFSAQGKATDWCPICYTDSNHHSYDCPKFQLLSPFSRAPMLPRSPTRFPQPLLSSPPVQPMSEPPAKRPKPAHCILYNKHNGLWPYNDKCKFPHRCACCFKHGHPVSACPIKAS